MKIAKRISQLETKKPERRVPFFLERRDGSIKSTDGGLLFDDREQFRQYLEEKKPDCDVIIFKPANP